MTFRSFLPWAWLLLTASLASGCGVYETDRPADGSARDATAGPAAADGARDAAAATAGADADAARDAAAATAGGDAPAPDLRASDLAPGSAPPVDAPTGGPTGGDASPDRAATMPVDAAAPACTPEPDADLCRRLDVRACGPVTAKDNCGVMRTIARCETCFGSACGMDGTCSPQCTSPVFVAGTKIEALSVDKAFDAPLGISLTGETVLHARDADCNYDTGYQILLSDRSGGAWGTRDITNLPGIRALRRQRSTEDFSYNGLSPDGLSVLGVTADGRKFVQVSRSHRSLGDFGMPEEGPFALINADLARIPSARVAGPVMSGDGLGFVYEVFDAPDASGFFESARRNTREPFPPGVRMPQVVQEMVAISGLSADRLTLFMLDTRDFTMRVVTRKDPSLPFANPRAPSPIPASVGIRGVPVGGCRQVLVEWAGQSESCLDADLYLFVPQP